MTFNDKCSAALALLKSKGISRAHYSPVAYRLLWNMGITIPPPHFTSFFFNFATLGILFALMCYIVSIITWLAGWSHEPNPWIPSPYFAAYGMLFGLVMGVVYHLGARKHAIPRWAEFHP